MNDDLIDEKWLEETGFGRAKDEVGDAYYYRNGLFLAKFGNVKHGDDHWRLQIGGTENMWECLHTPTRSFVRTVLKALGIPDGNPL